MKRTLFFAEAFEAPPPVARRAFAGGHFGELLQGRMGPQGPVALITLPCPALRATATRSPGAFALEQPEAEVLSADQAAAFLRRLGAPVEGRFLLRFDMPPGGGAGASTAARVALARACGILDPARISAACLATEGATDPLMFSAPERMLWASRLGRNLADLPPLAPLEVVGGFFGPPRRTDPADEDFPDVSDLAALWPEACGSAEALAGLATESAARSLDQRGPAGDPTADLAREAGALGWCMAHTGSARALLFRPGEAPQGLEALLREAGFAETLRFRAGGLS